VNVLKGTESHGECYDLAAGAIRSTYLSTLNEGTPQSGRVETGDTNMYRFSSCSGTEGFTVKLETTFGNADLLVWRNTSFEDYKAITSTIDSYKGVDTVIIEPNLGFR